MTNAIKFIEEAWGNGREMLVAIAELTTRQATTQFIAHYGNEEYYAHNDELQVDEHRRSLSERVRTLDINSEEAMQPARRKPWTRRRSPNTTVASSSSMALRP